MPVTLLLIALGANCSIPVAPDGFHLQFMDNYLEETQSFDSQVHFVDGFVGRDDGGAEG
jgi:hypothetical protein